MALSSYPFHLFTFSHNSSLLIKLSIETLNLSASLQFSFLSVGSSVKKNSRVHAQPAGTPGPRTKREGKTSGELPPRLGALVPGRGKVGWGARALATHLFLVGLRRRRRHWNLQKGRAPRRGPHSPSVKGAASGLRGNQRARGSAAAQAAPGETETGYESWASWLRRPRLESPPARPRCPRLGSQDPPAKPAATLPSPAVTGVARHR